MSGMKLQVSRSIQLSYQAVKTGWLLLQAKPCVQLCNAKENKTPPTPLLKNKL